MNPLIFEALIVAGSAFVGSLLGAITAHRFFGEASAKRVASRIYKETNEFMKKEEEALNSKIKRTKF